MPNSMADWLAVLLTTSSIKRRIRKMPYSAMLPSMQWYRAVVPYFSVVAYLNFISSVPVGDFSEHFNFKRVSGSRVEKIFTQNRTSAPKAEYLEVSRPVFRW